ncbi:OmpA family protein [Bordetella sp. H567]|uniref:OmpA family protein n=1 Tax=Bordetella sp. H567 TaxID=1697043 RepID=UPI000AF44830|nr:OmpA family protein [Bordetella sp. H567]
MQSELSAVQVDRGTLVSLPGDVLFDFDKATIRASAQATLDKLAELIKLRQPASVIIEGHTDSKGDDAYNQRLSEARAASVRAYLSQHGAGNTPMSVAGFGERKPVVPNEKPDGSDDPDGRQRNRRVEVVLRQS